MNKAEVSPEPIVIQTVVSVHILMFDEHGPRGIYGGVCPLLAKALSQAAVSEESGVARCENVFDPLGQDIYDVTYAALMRLRGLFSFFTYREMDALPNVWPETFKYSAVVTR